MGGRRRGGSAARWRAAKSSCAWAQLTESAQAPAPSALPGSTAMFGRFSDRPDTPIGQPQRKHPANLAAESVPLALTARDSAAVMTPRDVGLRADDVVASHRAADGGGPSIEGARTGAHGTSRRAVAAVSRVGPSMDRIGAFCASDLARSAFSVLGGSGKTYCTKLMIMYQ